MRFTITGRHVKLSPSIVAYAKEKIAKTLGKLLKGHFELSEAAIIDVEFTRVTRHHRKGKVWKADAALALARQKEPLYAEVTDEDIHSAIDLLAEEIEREIQKYKGKFWALTKRGARRAKKDMHLDPAARLYRKGRIREEGI